MQVRTATDLDVETMCSLFFASYNDLHRRHGLSEEDPETAAGWRPCSTTCSARIRTAPSSPSPTGRRAAFATSYREGALVGDAYVDEDEVIGPALGEDEGTAYAVVADLLRSSEHPEALTIPIHGNNAELFLMLVRPAPGSSPATADIPTARWKMRCPRTPSTRPATCRDLEDRRSSTGAFLLTYRWSR